MVGIQAGGHIHVRRGRRLVESNRVNVQLKVGECGLPKGKVH